MKKCLFNLLVIMLLSLGIAPPLMASANSGGVPYSVEPILPKNQDKGIERYISISPDSNSLKQELEFLVTNKSSEKLTLDIEPLNAYTSANGGIQYSAEATESNTLLDKKYEMKQYLESPKTVDLEGGQSKVIKINLNIDKVEGTILGGISFKGKGEDEQSLKEGVSFEIKNQINTIYGVVVNFPTDDKTEFTLDKAFLDLMPSYYVMRLPISLNSPVLLKDIKVEYEVMFKGKKIFFSEENIDYAPMTKTNFAIPFEHDEIVKNAPYTLKGTISYMDQKGVKKIEEFEQKIKYKDQNSAGDFFIKELKRPIEKGGPLYWMTLLVSIPLVIAIFIFLKRKKKAKIQEEKIDQKASLIVIEEYKKGVNS